MTVRTAELAAGTDRHPRAPSQASGRLDWLPAALAVLLASAFLLLFRLRDMPPGLHVDAAITGLDAQDVLHGHLAVFFPRNNGREALFIYYLAGMLALGGTDRLVYAFASAAVGLVSVALAFRLGRMLFGWRTAAIGTALLGVSVWAIHLSRIGLSVSLLAPACTITMYFLWRTVRWGGWRDVALAGICLGAALYTYQPVRVLPLAVLAVCVADWTAFRKRFWRLLAAAGIALLVFAPEGVFFLLHPNVAFQRTGEVSILSGGPVALVKNLARTAAMFGFHGDAHTWQNVPGRPVFDVGVSLFLLIGLLVSVARWRGDVRARWLLLWLLVMCLPGILTAEAPNQARTFGAAPAACLLAAFGWRWLWRLVRRPRLGAALAVPLLGVEAALGFGAYWAYAASPVAAVAFDAQDSALVAFAQAHPGQTIYFSDIRTLAGQPARAQVPSTQQQGWYAQDSAAIPLPSAAADGDVYYVGSPRSAIGQLAPVWLPQVQTLATTQPDSPAGMWAFRWPAAARQQFLAAQQPFQAGFGQDFALMGYSATRQGSGWSLTVLWRQLRPSGPYDLYTHVLDATGRQVAQGDKLVFPVERLGTGEHFGDGQATADLLLTRYDYTIPPGSYAVELGVVHRSTANLSQLLAAVGQPVRLHLDA